MRKKLLPKYMFRTLCISQSCEFSLSGEKGSNRVAFIFTARWNRKMNALQLVSTEWKHKDKYRSDAILPWKLKSLGGQTEIPFIREKDK